MAETESRGWEGWTPQLAAFYADLLRNGSGAGNRHIYAVHSSLRHGLIADLQEFKLDESDLLSTERLGLQLTEKKVHEAEEELEQLLLTPEEDEYEEGSEGEGENVEGAEVEIRVQPSTAATLRRIERKQRSDSHNRQTLLGYPILGVKSGKKRFVGPILYWEVDLHYAPDIPKLELTKGGLSPTLNTTLLAKISEDEGDIDLAKEEILPLVLSDSFGSEELSRVVSGLKGTFELLRSLGRSCKNVGGIRDFCREIGRLGGDRGHARLYRSPLLINGPRTYAFLLDDLEKIGRMSKVSGPSVLKQVVGDVDQPPVEEAPPIKLPFHDTADGGDPLWFPFASNVSQRAVAQKLDRGRVITVQGPPGTGKSITIANLVCHLAAQGKSVLVTSHQRKALEVLSNRLEQLSGVALSVLRGDKESMAKLKSRLEGIHEASYDTVREARDRVEAGVEFLHELDRDLRRLARRFSELRDLEHENVSEHKRYRDLRRYDRLSPEDNIDYNEIGALADALRDWAHLYRSVRCDLDALQGLFRPGGGETTRQVEQRIANAISDLLRHVREGYEEVGKDGRLLGKAVLAARDDLSEAKEAVFSLYRWLEHRWEEAADAIELIGGAPTNPEALSRLTKVAAKFSGEELEGIRDNLNASANFFQTSSIHPREFPESVHDTESLHLRRAIKVLETEEPGFFAWHLKPAIRDSRNTLEEAGFPRLHRSTLDEDLRAAKEVLQWRSEVDSVQAVARRLVDLFPDAEQAEEITTRNVADHAQRLYGKTRAWLIVRSLPMRALSFAADAIGAKGASLSNSFVIRLKEGLEDAATWLDRREVGDNFRTSIPLTDEWREGIDQLLREVEDGELSEAGDELLSSLSRLDHLYPQYRKLVDLEQGQLGGLRQSLENLREQIRESEDVPDWLAEAESAIEAHRLSSLLRQSLAADPDDLEEVSERLKEGRAKRLRVISQVVERKRDLGIAEAIRKPDVSASLLELRKLLNRKNMTDSFLALKDRIDYRKALEVFPCWICTIDDVARIFPATPGLFDVLIVDEASQCPQAAMLPLAFRAKRMAIVGDQKQLQPASSRFMKEDNITLFQERHEISAHPKATFLNGKDSLLELAEVCRNGREFLNEHFRCDPEIIRWSNERFYDNRLRILTNARKNRSPLPLEVRRLSDADDDPEKKINRKEAKAVVNEVRRLVRDSGEEDPTIGIISPYRRQADYLQELLHQQFEDRPELINRHRIVASTADGFQGDERDIIVYSFRYGPSSHGATVTSLQREEERLNVAFTRAKLRCVCFVSSPINRFPRGTIRSFLEHAREEQNRAENPKKPNGGRPDQFDSRFEKEVCQRLRDQGYYVRTQEPCGRYRLDLVVEDDDGRMVAVECDGEWKFDEFGKLRPEDYQRQEVIERAGWTVYRISGRRWLLNPERELERFSEFFRQQSTREEEAALFLSQTPEKPAPGEKDQASSISDKQGEKVLEKTDEEGGTAPFGLAEDLLERLGRRQSEVITTLRKLARWYWHNFNPDDHRLFDSFNAVFEAINEGTELSQQEQKFLRNAVEYAEGEGFDADDVDLPE